jgi:rSAM/selenodomain-associated transferase 1
VKTRLCPPLTPDEAASLHGSFVLDAIERSTFDVRRPNRYPEPSRRSLEPRTSNFVDRFIACAPSASHVFFKIIEERHRVQLLDQIGEDLGARMDQAFRAIFARGYQRVLVVGTDLPSLPGACYTQALSLLADHDLALGPSLDGGYYLIGLRGPAPELFVGMPWSTDRVCALTRAKADALGLKTGLLPTWRDVDTIEDLLALIDETGLEAPSHGGSRVRPSPLAPSLSARTAGVLRLLASRLRARPSETRTAGV